MLPKAAKLYSFNNNNNNKNALNALRVKSCVLHLYHPQVPPYNPLCVSKCVPSFHIMEGECWGTKFSGSHHFQEFFLEVTTSLMSTQNLI